MGRMENDPLQPAGEDILDQLRDMPVGVNDPSIIGDAGPTDVPPGTDPPTTPRTPADEVEDIADRAIEEQPPA